MYDFDPTGVNPSNLIINELHSIGSVNGRDLNYFAAKTGPFFANSLVIVDANTGRELEQSEYTLGHKFEEASTALSRDVYYAVALTNPAATGSYYLRMQLLGGEFALSSNQLLNDGIAALSRLQYVSFEDLTGYPDVFPPGPHETSLTSIDGATEILAQMVELVDYLKSSDRNVNLEDVVGIDTALIEPLLLSLNSIGDNIGNLTDVINSIWYEFNSNGSEEIVVNPAQNMWVDMPVSLTVDVTGIYSITGDFKPEVVWTGVEGRVGLRWLVDGVSMVNSTSLMTRAAITAGSVVTMQCFITEQASEIEFANSLHGASLVLRKIQNLQIT